MRLIGGWGGGIKDVYSTLIIEWLPHDPRLDVVFVVRIASSLSIQSNVYTLYYNTL